MEMRKWDLERSAWHNLRIVRRSLSESDSDHSIKWTHHKSQKKYQALNVFCPVNGRYKDTLGFCSCCMANTSGRDK